MRTRLEYLDARELDRLPALLRGLQLACGEATRAVAERYFPYDGPVEWSLQFAQGEYGPAETSEAGA
ncbi:hypothetical protein ACFQZC_36870 [Streptacidiphilus monticola]|jgi:hypothetical protein